jgi:hypothetical protein
LKTEEAARAFLDGGRWSLTQPVGEAYVLIDGSRFAIDDAPWLYEGHGAFAQIGIKDEETVTLRIPRSVVLDWRQRIGTVPPDAQIRRSSPELCEALIALMELVLVDGQMDLTVRSLL